MSIIATNEGGNSFQPIEAGTYPARCIGMVHIGTIKESFEGQEKTLNKVRITWELPTELKQFKENEPEKPYVLSKEFTLSLHEKATLRQFLKGWRGVDFTEEEAKAFDVTKLIGVPCMLSVGHKESKGKTYAEINSVSKVIKGFTVPDQINETTLLTYDNFDFSKFEALPEFIRKKMEGSVEFQKIANAMQSQELEKRIQAQTVQTDNEPLPF